MRHGVQERGVALGTGVAPVRPVLALLLAAAALAGTGGAVFHRLSVVSPADRQRRESRLIARAEAALTRDRRALESVAVRLQRSLQFAEIVDGGGSAVRPERLFRALREALPSGPGWGASFFDLSGRAVAWAGEPGPLEVNPRLASAGVMVRFHVTRFEVSFLSPRGSDADRRGVLTVSRTYPTGILRPDLLEYLRPSGMATLRRIRAERLVSQEGQDLPVRLFVEPAADEEVFEDIRRHAAFPWAVLASGALVLLGVASRYPTVGLLAARLALLLGAPLAASGPFQQLSIARSPAGLGGLLASPADLFLTALVLLGALRASLARGPEHGRAWPPGAGVLRLAASILAAGLVPLFSREAGLLGVPLMVDLELFPRDSGALLLRIGWIAMSAAALGLLGASVPARAAALLVPGLFSPRTVLSALGIGCGLLAAVDGIRLPVLPILSALALGLALSPRLHRFRAADSVARATTVVFLVGSAVVVVAAGCHPGKLQRLERALEEAAARQKGGDAVLGPRAPAGGWETALQDPALEPWLPGGTQTVRSDLARALWLRGAGDGFPDVGDVLTVRDGSRQVVSSFGVVRPGREARGDAFEARIPLPGLSAEWLSFRFPASTDRDSLLQAVVERDLPDRIAVERLAYDAAGRSQGRAGERSELSPALLSAARRQAVVVGSATTLSGEVRMRVTAEPHGFVAYATAADPAGISLGSGLASGELALLLLLPALVLLPGAEKRRPRLPAPRELLTFRARLLALVFVLGSLPAAGSVAVVRFSLERHSAAETARRARTLLGEARRTWPEGRGPTLEDLNRASAVVGTDLLLYRDGQLVAASRALPVAAGIAPERLSADVAQALAEGRGAAAVASRRFRDLLHRVVEAAEPLSEGGSEALAVVLAEDETARGAVDSLVLLTVAVALAGFLAALRAALTLSRPVEQLIGAAESLGSGADLPALEQPDAPDLARLVQSFQEMARRIDERTASLAREKAAAEELIRNLKVAVLLFRERDGGVLLANPEADRLLPPGGAGLAQRLRGPGWAPLLASLEGFRRRPRESRAPPTRTQVRVAVGDEERDVVAVLAKLPADGDEPRALLLLEDLTDVVRAGRLSAWVDAARAIAHDIKNPLTPIRLAAERMQRFEARGEHPPAGLADGILRQVDVLRDRIDRLARFSDPATLSRVPLDREGLLALLEEVAAPFRNHDRIAVEVSVGEDLPIVTVDRPAIHDALANLVVNAFEAIGSASGRVVLSAERDPEGGARISCRDDGPGVSAEQLGRLFEPMFSTKSRGSGMGLAATRRTVERHGGRVFASAGSPGLTIGFLLP